MAKQRGSKQEKLAAQSAVQPAAPVSPVVPEIEVAPELVSTIAPGSPEPEPGVGSEPALVETIAEPEETPAPHIQSVSREMPRSSTMPFPVIQKGTQGKDATDFQEALEYLGYKLTRFGADGFIGDEVFGAVEMFEYDHGLADTEGKVVREQTVQWVFEIAAAVKKVPTPAILDDLTAQDSGKRIRRRTWADTTGFTLHQTACNLGEKNDTWLRVPVQTGVTKSGRIKLLNPINWVTYHGNGFNSHDIGIEFDGKYAGIEGDLKTFWKPQGAAYANWKPDPIVEVQVNACRELMRWCCAMVAAHKGKITYVHAHRQSSDQRTSDPGSALWQALGLWAQLPVAQGGLGLTDGGPGFKIGKGLAIPEAWDSSRKGIKYL